MQLCMLLAWQTQTFFDSTVFKPIGYPKTNQDELRDEQTKTFHNFSSLFQIECVSMEMEYTLHAMLISRIPMQRLMIKAYTQCFCVGSLMGRCVLVSKEWRRFSQNMIALWIHFRTLKSLSSSIMIRFCRNGLLSTQLLEVCLLIDF